MRTRGTPVVMITSMLAVVLGCGNPEREKLSRAEDLYRQGKPTEALRLAFKVQQRGQYRAAATSLISKISAQYLVVTSEPQGLEVFVSPVSALEELPSDSDPKTSLAEVLGDKGVPRMIGCKTFFAGSTPVALSDPESRSAIAILYAAAEGETVTGKRAFNGAIAVRGKPSFELTAMGGLAPRDASICLWDDAKKRSGQFQMLSSGQVVAVAMFWQCEDRQSPVHVQMTPEALYESMAGKSLSLQ